MFYISSHGHAASGWLSKVLSKHPRIVCWHGTRSIPPYKSGIRDLSEEDFVKGLIQCEESSLNQKVFGACHGFYGTRLYKEVKKNNGLFLATVRNPIMRTHSHICARLAYDISSAYLPDNYKFDIVKFYRDHNDIINKDFPKILLKIKKKENLKRNLFTYLKDVKLYSPLKKAKNKIRKLKIKKRKNFVNDQNLKVFKKEDFEKFLSQLSFSTIADRAIRCFIGECDSVFQPDEEIYLEAGSNNFVKMEEMTISSDYFNKNIFHKILGQDAEASYLSEVFKTQALNKHSFKIQTHKEIFDSWPKSFQEYFSKRFQNSVANNLYKEMNYNIEEII